jgi:Protein of unknown function (DUF1682)
MPLNTYILHPDSQITDQPRVRPSVIPSNKEKHVTLSLVIPPPSRTADSAPLVSALFGLIDALEKVTLRPETKSKLKKTREDFAKTLKDEAGREAREEAADAKLAAKRRAEEERIASLSAAEQQKVHSLLLLAWPLFSSVHTSSIPLALGPRSQAQSAQDTGKGGQKINSFESIPAVQCIQYYLSWMIPIPYSFRWKKEIKRSHD